MTMPLCIDKVQKEMIDWVSVEEPDWSAEASVILDTFKTVATEITIFKYNLKSEKLGQYGKRK